MLTGKRLQEKALLLKQLEREAADLNTRIENIKNELKEEMTRRGVDCLAGDDYQINWTTFQSNRFDQSAFKSSHPDLFEQFKTVTESRRFTVK